MLALQIRPTRGQLLFDSQDVSKLDGRNGCGKTCRCCPHEPRCYSDLTAQENLQNCFCVSMASEGRCCASVTGVNRAAGARWLVETAVVPVDFFARHGAAGDCARAGASTDCFFSTDRTRDSIRRCSALVVADCRKNRRAVRSSSSSAMTSSRSRRCWIRQRSCDGPPRKDAALRAWDVQSRSAPVAVHPAPLSSAQEDPHD